MAPRYVLVGHQLQHSGIKRKQPLVCDRLRRVFQLRQHIVPCHARVGIQHFRFRPTLCEQSYHVLYAQPGRLKDRLSAKHAGIYDDSVSPIHRSLQFRMNPRPGNRLEQGIALVKARKQLVVVSA